MLLQRSISSLAASTILLAALACSPSDSDYSAADSAADRDLSLAQQRAEQTQYALNDAPTKRKVSPPDTRAVIPAGTRELAALSSRVCTSAKAGDKVTATLSDAMTGSNGALIPAGATVNLEVVSTRPMSDSTKGNISFRVRSIESGGKSYTVVATASPISDLQLTRTTKTSSDVKKVAGGAAAGAIIGQVIGKNTKGTVIGAAAGAAAGTAVALATGKYEGCVGEKGAVQIVLTNAIVVSN